MKKYIDISFILVLFLVVQLIYALQEENKEMPHGDITIDCEQCHTPADWSVNLQKITFKHETSGFPLLGAHKLLSCRKCHESLVFSQSSSACNDCHKNIHEGELGSRCDLCHNTIDWENRQQMWEQHNRTSFPLVGVHAVVDCEACHYSPDKKDIARLPIDCQGCHQENYQAAENPDHQMAAFSTNCEECHPIQSVSWQNTIYQHTTVFKLDGAHQSAPCNSCHQNMYAGTSAECYSCHQQDYQQTTDPDHEIFGFITTCQTCHNTSQWEGASFDHIQASGFVLSGAHQMLQCTDCHLNNQTTGLPRECFGCHESDYNAVQDPPHLSNAFNHNCLICHNDISWSPATFNHSVTQFPLTGAHLALACIDCHASGYAGTPTDCYSCHQSDFNGVSDPNHMQNNFDHDCTVCHSTQAWSPSTFNHATTNFPLTGAHLALACIDCHTSGYTGTPTDCYSCHQNDFNSVSDPNHVQNNFDHDCTVCHTTQAWSPATFDHASTQFPLTGAHTSLSCVDCHAAGYTGTPTACFSCHQDDYNSSQDPNHTAAGFPTQCETCHNTATWTQTAWNHDGQYFPIYSGKHAGEWTICADCHVNPTNFAVFECIFCHEHDDPIELANEHQNVPNYQYNSIACYNCHPTGEE